MVLPFTPWPLFVLGCTLLLIGIRRARRDNPAPKAGASTNVHSS
ncbi:hypothetical protein [Streptomyces tubercidicus]